MAQKNEKLNLSGFRKETVNPAIAEIGVPQGERTEFYGKEIIKLGLSNAKNIEKGVAKEPWVSMHVQTGKVAMVVGVNLNDYVARGLQGNIPEDKLIEEKDGLILPKTDSVLLCCDGYNYFPIAK